MKVFWFDCETSGLDEKKHGIISLAYCVEIDGEIKEKGELFSNCEGKEIDDRALEINCFTRERIATFPSPHMMYLELTRIFGRYIDRYNKQDKFIAGGYNVQFDMKFLRQLWEDDYFWSWFAFGVIDPSQILRFLEYAKGTRQAGGKLTEVAQSLGIEVENAHDALADIETTIAVTKALIRDISP